MTPAKGDRMAWWQAAGLTLLLPGYTPVLVTCADCNAPLGVRQAPPSTAAPAAIEAYYRGLAELGNAHKPQHAGGWDPRINLMDDRALAARDTLTNLFGRNWPDVLKGLAK